MFGLGAVPAWLSRAVSAKDAPGERKKILIAIFQRGAVDGLNVVVPFGEKRYYELRPTIAVPAPSPGNEDAAVDLDGFFGLSSQSFCIEAAVGSQDARDCRSCRFA